MSWEAAGKFTQLGLGRGGRCLHTWDNFINKPLMKPVLTPRPLDSSVPFRVPWKPHSA